MTKWVLYILVLHVGLSHCRIGICIWIFCTWSWMAIMWKEQHTESERERRKIELQQQQKQLTHSDENEKPFRMRRNTFRNGLWNDNENVSYFIYVEWMKNDVSQRWKIYLHPLLLFFERFENFEFRWSFSVFVLVFARFGTFSFTR